MSKPWVKLWTEILHDRKMHMLTDRQFRVCVNLIAMAGIVDDDGELMPIEDMAFQLRMKPSDLLKDLQALRQASITDCQDGDWWLVHYEARQPAPPSASKEAVLERVHKHRAKVKAQAVTGAENSVTSVTTLQDSVTSVTTIDKSRIEETRVEEKRIEENSKSSGQAEMFGAVAQVCRMDGQLCRKQIGACAKALIKAEYTPADVAQFGEWWVQNDFRGKQGQAPTVAQMMAMILQSKPIGNGNGKLDHGHMEEDAEGRRIWRVDES
jgi:hypothetical protein